MKNRMILGSMMACGLLMGGCGLTNPFAKGEAVPVSTEKALTAKATFINSEGKEVGAGILTENENGVTISLKLSGLEPGVKAIHIHETGKCDKPDFKTAGSHFNPTSKQHGFLNPKGYHSGDLPNLKIPESGEIELEFTTKEFTLEQGKANSLLDGDGTAFIIHAQADDYKTDPSGNSGDRMVCGVIGL